jgi:hypothetical protein
MQPTEHCPKADARLPALPRADTLRYIV